MTIINLREREREREHFPDLIKVWQLAARLPGTQ